MAKKKKETRIKEEKKRLMEVFEDLDQNKKKTVEKLIDTAAFISISLEDLEDDLNENGWTETYKNGDNQFGQKKSAAADVHIALTKNLNAITKQLLDIVPQSKRKSKLEDLMNK